MPNIGLTELLVVLAIALLVIGPKRLPDIGRQLGRTIREFRRASSTVTKELGLDEVADDVRGLRDQALQAKDSVNVRKQLGLDDLGPLDLDADDAAAAPLTAKEKAAAAAATAAEAADHSKQPAADGADELIDPAIGAADADTPAPADEAPDGAAASDAVAEGDDGTAGDGTSAGSADAAADEAGADAEPDAGDGTDEADAAADDEADAAMVGGGPEHTESA